MLQIKSSASDPRVRAAEFKIAALTEAEKAMQSLVEKGYRASIAAAAASRPSRHVESSLPVRTLRAALCLCVTLCG